MDWNTENIVNACLVILLAHIALGVCMWLRVRKLYSFPGNFGFPIIGNVYYFYRTLFILLIDDLERYLIKVTEKYGKDGLCFHWIMGDKKAVVVSSIDALKKLAFHPNLADKPEALYRGFGVYSGGVFTNLRSDELWKTKRKEYSICMKKSRINREYCNTFNKWAERLVNLMLASPSNLHVHDMTLSVVHSVALETMYGIETDLVFHPDVVQSLNKTVSMGSYIMSSPKISEIVFSIIRPLDTLFLGKVLEIRKLIDTDVNKKLKLMQNSTTEEQYLSVMIGSRTKKYNDSRLTIKELHELLFVSTDTVTAAISNMMILLAVLPHFQERAWKEQFEIFGNDMRDVTSDDVKEMEFLDRFLKESLRFLSPPLIGKLASGDIDIDGITIPKGTTLILLLRYMKMDPKCWKNPEIFDPDRFLEETDTFKYTQLSFGVGIRNCPGMNFAILQMKIMLSKILRRVKLKLVDERIKFENIQYESFIMTHIKNPPLIYAEERK